MSNQPGNGDGQQQRLQQRGMLGVFGILLLILLLALAGVWLGREPPMRYERQGQNHFEPSEVVPGQTVSLCFRHIVWTRVCRARIHQRVKCVDPHPAVDQEGGSDAQHQVDVDVRQVTLPPGPVVLENKCRSFKVPSADECAPGPAAYTATFEATCTPPDLWWPYRVNVEPIPFTILRR